MGAILQGLLKPSTTKRDLYLVAGASAAATLTLVTLAKLALQSPPPPPSKVTPSPRRKVEALSKDDVDRLPYPPDVFPGARDVDSSVSLSFILPFFLLPHPVVYMPQLRDMRLMGVDCWLV